MGINYKKYVANFRAKSTGVLIKRYPHCNDDFRRIAREEFKKRRVPQSKLPYTKPKRSQRNRGFDFGFTHF